MPFALLLFLMLATLQDEWPDPFSLDASQSFLITWAGIFVLGLLGEAIALPTAAALRRDPANRYAVMRRFHRWRKWHLALLVGFSLSALYLFAWGKTIQTADQAWSIPGFKIALLLPLLVGLFLSWLSHYPVERNHYAILHYPHFPPFMSRAAYLTVQARQHLLLLLPALFLLVAHDGVQLLIPNDAKHALLMSAVGVGLLALALIVIPYFLRLFLGLRPLPDGELRDRLLTTARRLGFCMRDVLVWNTRRGVANAMVTGVVPWLRYVVLTDQLLHELSDDEIEAVFGHEVGHMKHHHMTFYMVFIIVSLMLLGGLWSAANTWVKSVELPEWLAIEPAAWQTVSVWLILGVVAAYILVVFGWLSRRCERQADVYGCKTVSPAAFIRALEKVADLNGIPREQPGFLSWWQHSTIADRIGFIQRMQVDPILEPQFQRRLWWTKWVVTVGLVALLGVLALVGSNWNLDWSKLL